MAYAAGSVVVLKSGGQLMTVVAATDDEIECVWLGEDGDLFRHTIPAVALEAATLVDDDEEDDEDIEDEEGEEEEEAAKKTRAA